MVVLSSLAPPLAQLQPTAVRMGLFWLVLPLALARSMDYGQDELLSAVVRTSIDVIAQFICDFLASTIANTGIMSDG